MRTLLISLIVAVTLLILFLLPSEPVSSRVEASPVVASSLPAPQPQPSAVPTELAPNQVDFNLLVKAMIQIESSNNPRARSRRGARGLLQVRPRTWRWVCKNLLKTKWDFYKYAYDPEKNIIVGYTYLNYLLARFGSVDAALCAYNCGPTRYVRNRTPPATYTYLRKVKKLYAELKKSDNSSIVKSPRGRSVRKTKS